MNFYELTKLLHVSCALISVCGFAYRGYLRVFRASLPTGFLNRVAPHIVDSLLLLSAGTLAVMSGQYPIASPWLTAKLVALLLYIALGISMMRAKIDFGFRLALYLLALVTVGYIILVAISKSPLVFPF